MRRSVNLLVPGIVLAAAVAALAQKPLYNNLGRPATEAEVRVWDIAVGPEGKELPSGSGAAQDGAKLFAQKCVACHGPTAEGTKLAPRLVEKKAADRPAGARVSGGIANWPFAPPIWGYIYGAMPMNQEATLSPDQAYALTAFLLSRNGIIQESAVMDAKTLAKVQMPNRKGFTDPPITEWKPRMRRPFP